MTNRALSFLVLGSLLIVPSACGTNAEEEDSAQVSDAPIKAQTTGGTGPGDEKSPTKEAAKETEAEGEAPPGEEKGKSGDTVNIKDFKFLPPTIKVKAGTKLNFVNEDRAGHTATADDGSFDTGSLDGGKEKAVTLEKPGKFPYICDFHPYMKGTVEVE